MRHGQLFRRGAIGCLVAVLTVGLALTSSAQDKFRARNYRVRIAVQHNVEQLVVRGSGPYQVVSPKGTAVTQLDAKQPYFVQITRGKPGDKIYRLVLSEMDPHQKDNAIALARKAKDQYQLPVKVLRIPAPKEEDSRILVTIGEYPNVDAARAAHAKLGAETIRFIYEDRARAQQGQVRLVKGDGTIIARDTEFLRLVPLNLANDSMRVLKIEGKTWSLRQLDKARHYRGEVELNIDEEGLLTAVNDLWVEYYLYSVVGAEIGQDAPTESLKAQAVCARSEAIAKIQRDIVAGPSLADAGASNHGDTTRQFLFDFFDTAMFQMYRGKEDEDPRVLEAVDATRGELLIWNGEAVDAVYGHSCGGVISSNTDMWDSINEGYSETRLDSLTNTKAPNLSNGSAAHAWTSSPSDSLCNPNQAGFPRYARGQFRWTKTFTGAEFSAIADEIYGVGKVLDVDVKTRKGSGRVRSFYIKGTSKTVNVDREMTIRRALSIPSTFFTIITDKDANGLKRLTIYGAGSGHGVGMCQMGAFMMGLKGYNYRQIMAHYFKDVKIRRMYQ